MLLFWPGETAPLSLQLSRLVYLTDFSHTSSSRGVVWVMFMHPPVDFKGTARIVT